MPYMPPVTTPDVPTVATSILLLNHAPPLIPSVSVIEVDWQTTPGPDIVPATGSGFTVITFVV